MSHIFFSTTSSSSLLSVILLRPINTPLGPSPLFGCQKEMKSSVLHNPDKQILCLATLFKPQRTLPQILKICERRETRGLTGEGRHIHSAVATSLISWKRPFGSVIWTMFSFCYGSITSYPPKLWAVHLRLPSFPVFFRSPSICTCASVRPYSPPVPVCSSILLVLIQLSMAECFYSAEINLMHFCCLIGLQFMFRAWGVLVKQVKILSGKSVVFRMNSLWNLGWGWYHRKAPVRGSYQVSPVETLKEQSECNQTATWPWYTGVIGSY